MKVELSPTNTNYTDFVTEGWRREKGKEVSIEKTLNAKNIELYPEKDESFVSIRKVI